MIPDSIIDLRRSFPHVTSLKYFFFPEDYRSEDAQYRAQLAYLVATDIITAQYVYDYPDMPFLHKVSAWARSDEPRDVRDVALVVSVIFFAVITCILVGIILA